MHHSVHHSQHPAYHRACTTDPCCSSTKLKMPIVTCTAHKGNNQCNILSDIILIYRSNSARTLESRLQQQQHVTVKQQCRL